MESNELDLNNAETALSGGLNLLFIDFVILGICFVIIVIGFIYGKKFFAERGILFPASLFIFFSALSLTTISFFINELQSSVSLFIAYTSLIVFSLASADSKIYIVSKLQTLIFMKFKELSYSEFFVTKEDIKEFLIKKSGLKLDYSLSINLFIIIIGISALTCLIINYHNQDIKIYTTFILFLYISYFIYTFMVFKLMEKQKMSFELLLNDFISNKAYQKALKTEIEFGPTYYIDKVKNIMVLVDGNHYSQAYFSDMVMTLKEDEINKLLDRANGKGRYFHT